MTFTNNGNGTAALSGTPTTVGSYPMALSAVNAYGTARQTLNVAVQPAAEPFFPVAPVRVMDTRTGTGTGGAIGPVQQGASVSLQVAGVVGVPSSRVTAVVLNMTAVSPTQNSVVIVHPDGIARPAVSNLNFAAGQTIANMMVVKLGSNGKIDLYSYAGTVQLVVDLAGYY